MIAQDPVLTPYYSQSRPEMMRFIPIYAQRVLEVGCAAGLFGERVKRERQAEVWGIEVDPDAAQVAAGRLDHVLVGGVFESLARLPRGYFDCIVFNDVLEHLEDPYTLLLRVKPYLHQDGAVVASIPNVRHYRVVSDLVLRGEWDYVDEGVLDRTHLRFFTKRSIRKMFSSLGYRVDRLHPINASQLGWALSKFLPERFADLPYKQFACVARPAEEAPTLH